MLTEETFGGLKCRLHDVLPVDVRPSCVVVLCHGFGAPGTDLTDFGPFLTSRYPALARSCRFVFPEAPLDLADQGMPGGRAWWLINMARLALIHQTENYEELTTAIPDGMHAASDQLNTAVTEILAAENLGEEHLILGGFSQGAMIVTDLVLRLQRRPQLLSVFSGTMLSRHLWEEGAVRHSGTRVLMSHGSLDQVLPPEPARQLRQLLVEQGFEASLTEFRDGHTIPINVLEQFAAEVEQLQGE